MTQRKSEKGFIAIISAVVMSAILMLLMYTVSASSFYARYDAQEGEYKRMSSGLAEACINIALLGVATSSDPRNTTGHGYDPVDQVVRIGTDDQGRSLTCTIDSVSDSGSVSRTISASAEYQSSYSSIEAIATIPDPLFPGTPHNTLIVHM